MPNRKYEKGVRKERKIVNEAKARGCIALRSAGSKSPLDVVSINFKDRVIELIQSKSDKWTTADKLRLLIKWQHLNGKYDVVFKVV